MNAEQFRGKWTHFKGELKQKWGWSDPRNTEEYKNCDICANDIFRHSWEGARGHRSCGSPQIAGVSVAGPLVARVTVTSSACVIGNAICSLRQRRSPRRRPGFR